jgi:hypothetical protein
MRFMQGAQSSLSKLSSIESADNFVGNSGVFS